MCEAVCTPIMTMFLPFFVFISGDLFTCMWVCGWRVVPLCVCVLAYMLFYMLNVHATGCGMYVLACVLAVVFLACEQPHSIAKLKLSTLSIRELVSLYLGSINPKESVQ